MLCIPCQRIFLEPRKLSYGTYYPWGHSRESFEVARQAGCHLCNLIWEARSYEGPCPGFDDHFPNNCTYAFKILDPAWARNGNGAKWLVPATSGDEHELDGCSKYVDKLDKNPTINRLASLLAIESEELFARPADFWLVLDFYCPGPRIVLPVEVVRDDIEQLAQIKLEEQISTGTEENLRLASSWLRNCINNHPQCRPTLEDESWLPTRLVYVGELDDAVVRIVVTSTLPNRVPYAALSHRWDNTKDYNLTSALLPRYKVEIPVSRTSATMKDAFQAARGIGLHYLWVDCICIVQDDPDDWSRESATMSKVYGLATCTIAAALDGNGDDGCFASRNQYKVRPCKIQNPFVTDSNLSFYIRSQYLGDIYKREVKDSLWYSRGWVFQERTLTPRLLIFGKTQMLWACHKLQAAETWPCGRTCDDFIDRFESFEVEKSRLRTLLDKDKDITPWDMTWSTFILAYTRSNLTRMSDRLIALQGLASQIECATGRRYCAGLWIDQTLPLSLLWTATSPKLSRSSEYRAPTWSWASIDGPVCFHAGYDPSILAERSTLIEVLGTVALKEHEKHISRVPLAALQISGSIASAILVTSLAGDVVKVKRKPHSERELLHLGRFLSTRNLILYCWRKTKRGWLLFYVLVRNNFRRSAQWCMQYVIIRSIVVCGNLVIYLIALPFIFMWYCATSMWCCMGSLLETWCPNLTWQIKWWFHWAFPWLFRDVESWRPATPEVPESMKTNLQLECSCDTPLDVYDEIEVVCLPIFTWYDRASRCTSHEGLILQLAKGELSRYERLGTFKTNYYLVSKLSTKQTIILV